MIRHRPARAGAPAASQEGVLRNLPSDVSFTPAVKAIQRQKGSRADYARMEQAGGWQAAVMVKNPSGRRR